MWRSWSLLFNNLINRINVEAKTTIRKLIEIRNFSKKHNDPTMQMVQDLCDDYQALVAKYTELEEDHQEICHKKALVRVENKSRLLEKFSRVINWVHMKTGIKPSQIRASTRELEVVRARQLFCWISREVLDLKVVAIGAWINRDHSTVIHSARKLANIKHLDPEMSALMDEAKEEFYPTQAQWDPKKREEAAWA